MALDKIYDQLKYINVILDFWHVQHDFETDSMQDKDIELCNMHHIMYAKTP